MNLYEFNVTKPSNIRITGKFVAPSQDWTHQDFAFNDFELIVMTHDSLYISYNKVKYRVNEGEYLLLAPADPPNNHRRGYHPSNCSFYWMHFSPYQYSFHKNIEKKDMWSLCSENKLIIPEHGILTHPQRVVVLMKQLQDFMKSKYDNASLSYLSTTVLCEIYNQVRLREGTDDNLEKKQIINDIIDYIQENLNCNLKAQDIAHNFGYNAKYLSHIFKEITGTTVKQHIVKSKIEAANYMLSDTNMSIQEIATSLGFSDCHNFMKLYKHVTGLRPSEYRNTYAQRLLFHV